MGSLPRADVGLWGGAAVAVTTMPLIVAVLLGWPDAGIDFARRDPGLVCALGLLLLTPALLQLGCFALALVAHYAQPGRGRLRERGR